MDGYKPLYQAVAAVFIFASSLCMDLSFGYPAGNFATATLASIGSAAVPEQVMVMLVGSWVAGIPERLVWP